MNRKQRNKRKRFAIACNTGKVWAIVLSKFTDKKKPSRVNRNRQRAKMSATEPRTCDNCYFKEIFWCFADMMCDIENTCFRCSKQQWCFQTHLETKRVVEILPQITKRNMWKALREAHR